MKPWIFLVPVSVQLAAGIAESLDQEPTVKERTGTVVGRLVSRKMSKNGNGAIIEILADGEQKARAYFVAYNPKDPTAKKPFEKLFAAVLAAGIGDRVQCDWVNGPPGSEGGFFVRTFQVLKKADQK